MPAAPADKGKVRSYTLEGRQYGGVDQASILVKRGELNTVGEGMPAPDYGNEGAKLMVAGWLAGPDLPACLTVPALPVLPAVALPSRVYLSSCLSSCLCSVLCSDFLYYSCNQPTPTYLPALSCLAAPLSCLPAAPCRHQQRHGVDALGPGERPLRPRALHLRSRRAGVHLRGHQRVCILQRVAAVGHPAEEPEHALHG